MKPERNGLGFCAAKNPQPVTVKRQRAVPPLDTSNQTKVLGVAAILSRFGLSEGLTAGKEFPSGSFGVWQDSCITAVLYAVQKGLASG